MGVGSVPKVYQGTLTKAGRDEPGFGKTGRRKRNDETDHNWVTRFREPLGDVDINDIRRWLIYLIDHVVDNLLQCFTFPTDKAHSFFRT